MGFQGETWEVSRGKMPEINTWKCYTQTKFGLAIYGTFMLNIVQAELIWGRTRDLTETQCIHSKKQYLSKVIDKMHTTNI